MFLNYFSSRNFLSVVNCTSQIVGYRTLTKQCGGRTQGRATALIFLPIRKARICRTVRIGVPRRI